MDALDIFRLRPDGSFVWIGSADSLPTALNVIKTLKVEPSDAFLIHDSQRNDTLTVRADEGGWHLEDGSLTLRKASQEARSGI